MGTESARKCRVEDAAEEQGGGTAQLQCQSGAHKNEGRAQAKAFLVEVQARTSETGHFTKNDVNPLQSNPYQTTSCNGNDCGDKQQV